MDNQASYNMPEAVEGSSILAGTTPTLFLGATPPSTSQRLSVGKDIKGKGRAVEPPGNNLGSADDDVEGELSSEAALAKAIQDLKDLDDNNAAEIKENAPASTKQHRQGSPREGWTQPREGWTQHPSRLGDQLGSKWRSAGDKNGSSNIPDRTEAFLLDPGQKKVEPGHDTRTPNTMIFVYNKEDHTLGNALVDQLHKNSHVTYAAYRVPHPLFARFELRIQTDGEITPKEALLAASRDVIRELEVIKVKFTREYELRKMVGNTTQNNEV
ncbi:hypothetical protein ABEF95_004848 [Exophiala dermatitidis]